MQSFIKAPNEIKAFSIDFTPVLATSETITLGNATITVIRRDTDADVTATLLDAGSTSLTGNVISFRIKVGAAGVSYKITVNTGLTSAANKHEEDIILLITEDNELLYTVDELKTILNITTTDKDAILYSILKGASDYVKHSIDREINLKDYTETLYLEEPSKFILVNEFPIVSVTSVLIDGVTLDATLGGVRQWITDSEGRIRRTDGLCFPSAPIPVVVTYKAGFQVVPEDIRAAVRKVAILEFKKRSKEGVLAETIGNYRIVFNKEEGGDSSFIYKIISRYARRLF